MLHSESPEFLCPEGFRLDILPGNNVFRFRALLWDARGAKVFSMLWCPYSPRLNSRIMTVQLANQWLYSGMIGHCMALLNEVVECEFNNLGRVDVCVDWEINQQQLDILHSLCAGSAYMQGKKEGSIWWHDAHSKAKAAKVQSHCLSFGSPTSEIKVKIYHKSREQGMLTTGNEPDKPWIVARWLDAKFDTSAVWRLEFSLCSSGQLRYENKPITLKQIGDEYFCARLLNGLYDKRCVMRRNEGKRGGHKNRDEVLLFLSLPDVPIAPVRWQGVMRPFAAPAAVSLLRRLMGDITNPSLMSNASIMKQYESVVRSLVDANGLHGYFLNHYGSGVDDFFGCLDCGEGIHEDNAEFLRFFD